MTLKRWLYFFLAIGIGIGLGLLYGWAISPVTYTDTSPDTLRADFRADYVLMTAEIFQADRNLDQAQRSIALLGSDPAAIASQAAVYARDNNYNPIDIALMESLAAALRNAQPSIGGNQP
jgi:hypothetical protein